MCYPSDLSGFDPTTYDMMVLYYRLMTKVDWFRRYYGIFLGRVITMGKKLSLTPKQSEVKDDPND
jgi:hypothetical protein